MIDRMSVSEQLIDDLAPDALLWEVLHPDSPPLTAFSLRCEEHVGTELKEFPDPQVTVAEFVSDRSAQDPRRLTRRPLSARIHVSSLATTLHAAW